ncbi:MAG: YhcN/YlaJ family sporulation lipoprotein [Clostridiaceae bacterium]|nr:YhcN/YlaJ family sporulation lipoprotein [Clostridiaceae bacterium]MBW4859769.1 YhcN/YlaJ family sporulation lipoprotein [Clostridiaceae bacterium]MBW4869801.1 YhcN/YlaJ family sporulation lipoprotein [Clostridiaceae bacterium]
MKKTNKKLLFLLISMVIASIFISGCKKGDVEKVEEDIEQKDVSTDVGAKKSNELVDRGEKIADSLVELIGVEGAAAIIYDNEAIVAVEISEEVELDENMINMIKNTAVESDGHIEGAKVIADKKTFDIIDDIAQALIKGDSIDKYKKEIDNIVQKTK